MKIDLCANGQKAKYVVFRDASFGVCAIFFSSKKDAIKYIGDFKHPYSLHDVSGRLL